jgi:hypothetical protein
MKKPHTYLVDSLINYANESGISYGEASSIIAEFARQRAPELASEREKLNIRYKLQAKVENSPKEYFIARFLVVTRVRYIAWTYYPEFHVCSEPCNYTSCSIEFTKPTWLPSSRPDEYYMDDLFHDEDAGKFWMHEPYLVGLPSSHALFKEITKTRYETLAGTNLRKIDPRIVAAFKAKRKGIPEFSPAYISMKNDRIRPPYGSKGWRQRVKLVPISFKKVRLK